MAIIMGLKIQHLKGDCCLPIIIGIYMFSPLCVSVGDCLLPMAQQQATTCTNIQGMISR
jgi:hypothetical protein